MPAHPMLFELPRRGLDFLGLSAKEAVLLSASFLLMYASYQAWATYALRKKMPPGPLGMPFVGNKNQIPAVKPWWTFEALNKAYGPVISLFIGGTPTIVLGSARPAWDLLEKRSEIYSSRPRFITSGEILSDNMRGLMLPNNDEWRKWRKILHSGFHSRQAIKYREIQSLESKVMMQQLVDDPSHYETHIQRYAASVVVSVTYGRRVENVDEWIVREMNDSMDYLTQTNIPGKYIVESLPWLLKLPKSLQWFRREPEEHKKRDIVLLTNLVDDVKRRMDTGTLPDCLAGEALRNQKKIGMDDLFLAYSVSTPFGAGIETTAGTLCTFVLAMLHFPAVMKKAQAEIDKVVGPDRMPDYGDADSESLPYITALGNETLRWRPVAILGGTPHASTADDVYEGMFIPKGSTIFANFAGIMRNEDMFPDPDNFRPERFLESKDPRMTSFELPFGFGRRVCPGMHLARNSIFINIARILWAFDILPAVSSDGKPILPDPWNYTDGFNSRPRPFPARFVPRSDRVLDTIKAEFEGAQGHLGTWNW